MEKNKLKKRLAFSATCLCIFLSSIFFIFFLYNKHPVATSDIDKYSPAKVNLGVPSNEAVLSGAEIKRQSLEGNQNASTTSGELAVTITAIKQGGNTLQIRVLLDAITNNGTCTLELIRKEKKVSFISGVQAVSSSSTCKGFDVPVSDLSSGEWNIQLSVTTEIGSGSTSRVVEIK